MKSSWVLRADYSAQSNIGDMTGQFLVPYFSFDHHHDMRRHIAEGVLQRHRKVRCYNAITEFFKTHLRP